MSRTHANPLRPARLVLGRSQTVQRLGLAGLLIALSLLVMAPVALSGTPTCLGKAVTQDPGTNGDDDLSGTSGDDVILAKGGNDDIDGKGGDDRICGGGGKDQIVAGSGKDQVTGDDGADKIDVADGEADVADGAGGADTCKTDSLDKVKSCVSESVSQCSDGKDNDNDGKVDTSDPGCSDASDDSESPDPETPKPQCADGTDNDNDGKVDTNDPGCSSSSDNSEDTPECSDGVDNDNDGKTDFHFDSGCSSSLDDSESQTADLAVRGELSAPQVDDAGRPYYIYKVFPSNKGPDTSSPPTVTIQIPDNFTFEGTSVQPEDINVGAPGECQQSGNTITCSFFYDVRTFDAYSIDVYGRFTSAASATFTATVSSSTTDPDSSNNSDSTTVTPAECANGVDDDNDGKTDYPADTDCASASGTES